MNGEKHRLAHVVDGVDCCQILQDVLETLACHAKGEEEEETG